LYIVGPKGKPPITGPAERRDHLVSTFNMAHKNQ